MPLFPHSESLPMPHVVTFGEVMIRLMPPGNLRLTQQMPGSLEATFGGAEANVAMSICRQGGTATFCTALPDNPLTDAFTHEMRRWGVSVDGILRVPEGRFGIYFVENGANQRAGVVTYDRAHSAISLTPGSAYPWDKLFQNADWLHLTGITPSLSETAAEAALMAAQVAVERGLTVSCDLNFRQKLWRWEAGTPPQELAARVMRQLLPFVQVLIANEEDAAKVLGIHAPDTDVHSGQISVAGYQAVAAEVVRQFPNLKSVAITLRESLSASHNRWGALYYDATTQTAHAAPRNSHGDYVPYDITQMIDRVGAGDSFAAGLIFALRTPELSSPDLAVRYATAASCLKHSLRGDFNDVTRSEIEALMKGSGGGRVQR